MCIMFPAVFAPLGTFWASWLHVDAYVFCQANDKSRSGLGCLCGIRSVLVPATRLMHTGSAVRGRRKDPGDVWLGRCRAAQWHCGL